MRNKVLALFVIGIFLISTPVTPQAQNPNFELKMIFAADTLYLDAIAQIITQQLAPLLISILDAGTPRPTYLTALQDHNYDLAIVNMDLVSNEFPSLWSQYSQNSTTAQELYRTSNSDLMADAGIEDTDTMFQLLDDYKVAEDDTTKIELAKQIQSIYNEQWLLDIPLTSTSTVMAAWDDFSGMDFKEGLVKSLMLGAKWTANPTERQDRDRPTSEFHYSMYNYDQIRNPLYYIDRASYMALEPIFSTAFLVDKEDRLHPNLAVSFEDTSGPNGTNSWILNLREDATWSDGEVLDAYDLKFTYDMASSDWIGASNVRDWDNLHSVELIDQYTLNVTFSNNALTNRFALSDQFIIPEHILNQTFTVNGEDRHPYDGFNPSSTSTWINFAGNPVTAGPYTYNYERSGANSDVFEKYANYWSPGITDTPNNIFNLTAGVTHPSYYFSTVSDVSIDTLVYHTAASVDTNSQDQAFTTGSRDMVEFRSIDDQNRILSDERFNIEAIPNDGGGLVVLFNPENSALSQFEVRKAITQAIDRSLITQVIGVGQLPQLTPVSRFYTQYYNTQAEIQFDYPSARDTFRQLGYDAYDDPEGESEFEWPWQRLPLTVTPVILGLMSLILLRWLATPRHKELR